jgi:hypothetical protein
VTLDIEAQLRRFELGESELVAAVAPLPLDALEALGAAFCAQYEASGDLRYLNAVMKIVDRAGFAQSSAAAHARLREWADARLEAFRRQRGLA